MSNTDTQRWKEFCMKAEDDDAILTRTISSLKVVEWLLSPVSRLIQGTTKSRWTHVMSYRGAGRTFQSTFPRATADGYLDSFQPKWYNYTEVALIRLNDVTIDKWQAVKTFWYNKILGHKYDVAQLVGIEVNAQFGRWDHEPLFKSDDKYICSEAFYMSNMYGNVDVSIPGINKDMFAPRHVADLVRLGKARLIDHFIPEKYKNEIKQGDIWEYDPEMTKLAIAMNPNYSASNNIV